MRRVGEQLSRLMGSAVTAVHIFGETGTGKEVVCGMLEDLLPAGTSVVRINCGAISPTLLESELFGHVKGAFTGATSDKRGLIESAHGGWVFLDEIQLLSAPAQAALLRVLENNELIRVGDNKVRKVEVNCISAANIDLAMEAEQGRFRGDLWQRICEIRLELPPLRDRQGEVPGLVEHFSQNMKGGPYTVSEAAMGLLTSYTWDGGNIRELRNCLRAMTVHHVDKTLTPMGIPPATLKAMQGQQKKRSHVVADSPIQGPVFQVAEPMAFEVAVDQLFLFMVERTFQLEGKQSLRSLSEKLGIPRTTLTAKLKRLIQNKLVDQQQVERMVGFRKTG